MALGKLSTITNIQAKVGANETYCFMKVQSLCDNEEYWMLTELELKSFTARARKNPEDYSLFVRRGVFRKLENKDRKFGANDHYYGVKYTDHHSQVQYLLMTEKELERVRYRPKTNPEDVAANKVSWISDLLD